MENQLQMAILGLTSLQPRTTHYAWRKRSHRSIERGNSILSESTFPRFIISTTHGCEPFPSIVNSEFFSIELQIENWWIWIINTDSDRFHLVFRSILKLAFAAQLDIIMNIWWAGIETLSKAKGSHGQGGTWQVRSNHVPGLQRLHGLRIN